MPSYQRFARYQERRTASNGQLIRWFVYIVVLVVIIWLVSGCLNRGGDETGSTTTNENANAAPGDVGNANGNGNSNVNGSAEARVATVESFSVETQCEGVISQSGREKKAVLTFGGRGTGGNADEIVKVLQDANVPASFFFTGTFAENNPEVVKSIADAGFRVYNQSDTHPDFEDLTEDEMLEELEQADEKLSAVTGLTTKPFFRPPFGSVTETVTDAVKSAGYCPVTWTVDGMDWQASATADSITSRVLDRAANGMIILLQVGGVNTEQSLPGIITELRGQGYEFVSLADLVS